jgi:7-cyano-7-deazaguanine synthase
MKALIAMSGGMDSATVVAKALDEGREVFPICFQYGSKHNNHERVAAAQQASSLNMGPLIIWEIPGIFSEFKSNLLKSGGEVPEGHYQDSNMAQTVVPGRNTIFAALLLGYAQSYGLDEIWLGIHSGDHMIYPDCRPAWFNSMQEVIMEASENKILLKAPFLFDDKTSIIKYGLNRNPPVNYKLTRTCYKDQPIACGKCGSCQERLEAFAANGVEDPVEYESRELLPKA